MINLKVKTEYSFRESFGPIDKILEAIGDAPAVAITDSNSTWGHVNFHKACIKANKKPIMGVTLRVVEDLEKERYQDTYIITLLAKNVDGLKEIYRVNSLSFDQMYYKPRTTVKEINNLSDNVIILSGSNPPNNLRHRNLYYELNPGFGHWNKICQGKSPLVVTSDIFFPKSTDRPAYDIVSDNPEKKSTAQYILTKREDFRFAVPDIAFDNTLLIADQIEVYPLPLGEMISFNSPKTLEEICREAIQDRVQVWTEEYEARLTRELSLIKQKEFEDYFFMVADLCVWAKEHMLVGPARGSSAGSLVCYLMYITEVDPIPHGLIFERFIDITREDLPDIDIDFPDNRREDVIQYLRTKYGTECVSHIGTISRFKPKSAIGEAAKKYGIPAWETNAVKDAIIERSGGDARSAFCIQDTFESLDVGKRFIEKYPMMMNVSLIEEHARHSGCHAAGILVTAKPITDVCSVDNRNNIAQIDKYNCDDLELLKIDVLGLRTLTVLNSCMEYIGKKPSDLYKLPLDDKEAFAIVNNKRYSGIFQFEGYALQSLTNQMGIYEFNDIVAITSLARPGPLHCGGATAFILCRTGAKDVEYDHQILEGCLKETFGVTVYQEQVMAIAREVGNLEWGDVTTLRKAMSKSLGEEFFNKFWIKFLKGAKENGLSEKEADRVWKNMCTFGSWAFNKSHAVSYALLSYFCMYLKANHPLEFALACLNNEKAPENTIKMLRELVAEGYEFTPCDRDKSLVEWSIADGKLLGGLTSIKGIGVAKAEAIIERRTNDRPFLAGQNKLLDTGLTPWDNIFETETRFKDIYDNPEDYNVTSGPIARVIQIQGEGTWVFIAKIKIVNLRDLNEYESLQKRGGKVITGQNLFLNLTVEDDTDSIICTIGRFQYERIGKQIVEDGEGHYYLIKGKTQGEWRRIQIDKIRKLT